MTAAELAISVALRQARDQITALTDSDPKVRKAAKADSAAVADRLKAAIALLRKEQPGD